MANDLNRCEFIGRLGKDPEIRFTPGGKAVASFGIAVSESWKDNSTGQKQEKTTWVPVVMFGKLAEIAQQYLHKGSKVFIAGKFSVRKWQGQDGQDRYTTEIVVDGFSGQMQMLDGRQDSGAQSATHAPQQQRPANHPAQQAPQQRQQQQPMQRQSQQQQPRQGGGFDQFPDDTEIPF